MIPREKAAAGALPVGDAVLQLGSGDLVRVVGGLVQDPGRFSRFSRSELPTIDTQTDSWLQRVRPSENTDVDLGGVVVLVERPVMTLPMSKQCASPGLCPFPRSAHQLGHDVIGRVVESSADSSSPRCFVPQRSVDHGGNHSFAQCGSSVIRDYPDRVQADPVLQRLNNGRH